MFSTVPPVAAANGNRPGPDKLTAWGRETDGEERRKGYPHVDIGVDNREAVFAECGFRLARPYPRQEEWAAPDGVPKADTRAR